MDHISCLTLKYKIYLQNVIMDNDFIGVEKTTKSFLDKLQKNPGPPIYKLSPSDARNVLSGLQSVPVAKSEVDCTGSFHLWQIK